MLQATSIIFEGRKAFLNLLIPEWAKGFDVAYRNTSSKVYFKKCKVTKFFS
jgi:hypothetical protein